MAQGRHGELFVRKAPSASLDTILKAIEKLLGRKAKMLNVTGVRPGEKIHETLLNSEERTHALESNDYFKVPSIANSKDPLPAKERALDEFRSDNSKMLSSDELASILEQNAEIKILL
jgi:UDP-glucose 4-epimerase